MKREDVILLAREAGFIDCLLPEESNDDLGGVWVHNVSVIDNLERFAQLVRAADQSDER